MSDKPKPILLYVAKIANVAKHLLTRKLQSSENFTDWYFSEIKYNQPEFISLVHRRIKRCPRRLASVDISWDLELQLRHSGLYYIGRGTHDKLEGKSIVNMPSRVYPYRGLFTDAKYIISENKKENGTLLEFRYNLTDIVQTSKTIPYAKNGAPWDYAVVALSNLFNKIQDNKLFKSPAKT